MDEHAEPGSINPVQAQSERLHQLGRCRRHAPTMNGYPVVTNRDWCGDHKLAEDISKMSAGPDPWIHRSAGMRCESCMYFVPKMSAVTQSIISNNA